MSKLTIDPKARFCNMDKFADYICQHVGLSEDEANKFIHILWAQRCYTDMSQNRYSQWTYGGDGYGKIHCKLCGYHPEHSLNKDNSSYCPHCGASMKENANSGIIEIIANFMDKVYAASSTAKINDFDSRWLVDEDVVTKILREIE